MQMARQEEGAQETSMHAQPIPEECGPTRNHENTLGGTSLESRENRTN